MDKYQRRVSELRTTAIRLNDETLVGLLADAADDITELRAMAALDATLPDAPLGRADVLRQAERMVCGHREQDYGSPEDSFGLIAGLWSAYLGMRDITPVDVSMMMALLKIARIGGGRGTADSFIDLAGYAACGGEIATRKEEKE